MHHQKTLVILATLALLSALLFAISCAAPTAAPPVKETVVVKETVIVQPTAAPKPTEAPKPTLAPGPALKIEVPPETSLIRIVPVAANATVAMEPNAITTTVKYITDTAKGEVTGTTAIGTTGLPNHPVNVPMIVAVRNVDPKTIKTVAWALAGPPNTKAKFDNAAATQAKFTPDLVGIYRIQVTVTDQANVAKTDAIQIHAGTYIGMEAGNCKQCHAAKVEEWAKTGHAKIFSDEIDNKRDGPNNVKTHYSETCTRCHTTGWYAPPFNGAGGFYDVKTQANWKFPTWAQIDAAWEKKGPSNWDTAPAAVKNMANIQCEVCHGPAKEHVTQGARVMVSSQNEGVCNVCHNGGGHHVKGTMIKSAKHATGETFETISGPARQACVRCHSGDGYATFLKDPKNQAGWANEKQTVVCTTCHDPHDEKFAFQLRIAGKPVEITFEAKDVGLSATCYECHNARTKPADAVRGSFPHYSAVAEMLSDTGGVEYGQKLPNSPHGLLVGAAPMKNPAFAKDPATNEFYFSKIGDKKGNPPGACVVCHMWAGPTDSKDPNYLKVGEHSFNTKSPDGKTDYAAACQGCHAGMTSFNMKAKADYDGNGKVEGVQDEVKGLLNGVWAALEAKGVKQAASHPYWTPPRDAQGNTDDKLENAFYNFRTVYGVMWHADASGKIVPGNEGKSQAMHNFKRSVALLQLALKDLTGALPAGMADGTK